MASKRNQKGSDSENEEGSDVEVSSVAGGVVGSTRPKFCEANLE